MALFGSKEIVVDVIPDVDAKCPSEKLDEEKISEVVRQALGSLSEREEKILRLRFGISEDPTDHTKFPVTSGELSSIKKRAVDSLVDAKMGS